MPEHKIIRMARDKSSTGRRSTGRPRMRKDNKATLKKNTQSSYMKDLFTVSVLCEVFFKRDCTGEFNNNF